MATVNEKGHLVLSTGTVIDTSIMGVETLSPVTMDDWVNGERTHDLLYGYDGHVSSEFESKLLTRDERREVADFMIAVWNRWVDEL